MGFIVDFIDFIINTITSLWDLLTNMISGLVLFVTNIFTTISLYLDAISSLPPWLTIYGSITLGICISYLVVGRNAGKSG